MRHTTGRREFLTLLGACAAAGLAPRGGSAQRALPARAIPSSGESLPIVGLGSTRPVTEIGALGAERVESIVRALVEHGGKVVDTWPRNVDNDTAFGRIVGNPDLRDRLFVTINLDAAGAQAGSDQFERTLRAYQRDPIDLVNVGSLIDLDARWPSLKRWKDEGRARYVGVTAAQAALYPQLESFLEKEAPDFVEINYSVTERDAERRLSAAARGPRYRRAREPPVHERRVFRPPGERAVAGVDRGARVRELGAVLAAVHSREPGGHLRADRDDRSRRTWRRTRSRR